jgi:hypothetical protein
VRAVWRLSSLAAMTAGVALALLHIWIFWDRLVTGRLEGGSAIRWISGVLLVAGLVWLKRQGVSLWRGRPALTAWLLVVLLHLWSAGSQPVTAAPNEPVDTTASTFLLPLTAATLAGVAGLLIVGRRPRRPSPLMAAGAAVVQALFHGRSSHPLAIRVPRAPPLHQASRV